MEFFKYGKKCFIYEMNKTFHTFLILAHFYTTGFVSSSINQLLCLSVYLSAYLPTYIICLSVLDEPSQHKKIASLITITTLLLATFTMENWALLQAYFLYEQDILFMEKHLRL